MHAPTGWCFAVRLVRNPTVLGRMRAFAPTGLCKTVGYVNIAFDSQPVGDAALSVPQNSIRLRWAGVETRPYELKKSNAVAGGRVMHAPAEWCFAVRLVRNPTVLGRMRAFAPTGLCKTVGYVNIAFDSQPVGDAALSVPQNFIRLRRAGMETRPYELKKSNAVAGGRVMHAPTGLFSLPPSFFFEKCHLPHQREDSGDS